MGLRALDPKTALIAVDVQQGTIDRRGNLPVNVAGRAPGRLGETGSTQDVLDLPAKRSA
jgi:nicotinamidase-related amidase